MTEQYLKQLEELVGSDNFEYESEEIIEKLEEEDAGFEIVESLLSIMENHPLDDFGMPGAIVHFIEKYYPDHIPMLTASIERAPAMHTLWMLNRCINGSTDKEKLLAVMRKAADSDTADKTVTDLAKSFLAGHTGETV